MNILLSACLTSFISISAVLASNHADNDDHENARHLMISGDILPLEKILETVYKTQSGKILEVELEQENDTYRYEIELLDQNHKVWEIEVNAVTGKLITIKEED